MKEFAMGVEERVAQALVEGVISEIGEMLGLTPTIILAIIGKTMGQLAACIDQSVIDNEVVRNALIHKGMEQQVGPEMVRMMIMKNFDVEYEKHVKMHVKRREEAKNSADGLLNSVCDSHKKGK